MKGNKSFHLGAGYAWDDMSYYNRWPSPSLPPTLKKNAKNEPNGSGLHLSGGYSMNSNDDDVSDKTYSDWDL
jgi:hypothetical protein